MTAPLVVPSSPAIHVPPGLPGLGQLLDAWRDPLGLFLRGMAGGHAVVRYRFGPYTYLLLNEPGDVERVLEERPGLRQEPLLPGRCASSWGRGW
ncbi:MAG: hypothetical protein H6730_10510 [Deltaproteobacteria bacterium]|nr:hypothetical protein [Deltaproteobacteria bacterium]